MSASAPRSAPAAVLILVALTLVGCGSTGHLSRATSEGPVRLAPDLLPLRAGRSAAYRLPVRGAAVARRGAIGALTCRHRPVRGWGVHVELYARRLVVPVPAGIGIAPPLQRSGVYVREGTCSYPLRTYEPTGLVVIDHGSALRLADLFAVWGQPLSSHSLADFHGSMRAYLGGRRWTRDPSLIPLRRHAEIVLEVGAFVPPHPRYRFPPGL